MCILKTFTIFIFLVLVPVLDSGFQIPDFPESYFHSQASKCQSGFYAKPDGRGVSITRESCELVVRPLCAVFRGQHSHMVAFELGILKKVSYNLLFT